LEINLIAELKRAREACAKLSRKIWDAELNIGTLEAVRAAYTILHSHLLNLGVTRPSSGIDWEGETGAHRLPAGLKVPERLKGAVLEQALADLKSAASGACQGAALMGSAEFAGSAVNWSDLRCHQAGVVFDDSGVPSFIVWIGEAAPDAAGFQAFVQGWLDSEGFGSVEVITAW
jgi:hypothetical protein